MFLYHFIQRHHHIIVVSNDSDSTGLLLIEIILLDNEDDCDNGDYPSMDSEISLASPETSLSPRPTSLTESMQV